MSAVEPVTGKRIVALTEDDLARFAALILAEVEPVDAATMLEWTLVGLAKRRSGPVSRPECERYIELIEEGASRSEAAKALGRTATALTRACNLEPETQEALALAERERAYSIVSVLERRAVEGYQQEVYQTGKKVGTKLMIAPSDAYFVVKGVLPQYKDNPKQETTVQVAVNVEDRSAALDEMGRALREARAELVEGEVIAEVDDGRGAVGGHVSAVAPVLAEPSDV